MGIRLAILAVARAWTIIADGMMEVAIMAWAISMATAITKIITTISI